MSAASRILNCILIIYRHSYQDSNDIFLITSCLTFFFETPKDPMIDLMFVSWDILPFFKTEVTIICQVVQTETELGLALMMLPPPPSSAVSVFHPTHIWKREQSNVFSNVRTRVFPQLLSSLHTSSLQVAPGEQAINEAVEKAYNTLPSSNCP